MTIVRKNPLPPGRYWLDIFDRPEGKLGEWHLFLRAHKSIHVEVTEEQDTEPPGVFTIFRTSKEMFWPQTNFGFPNVAPPGVNTRDDTVVKPDVPQGPSLESLFAGVGTGGLLLLLGLLYFSQKKGSATFRY